MAGDAIAFMGAVPTFAAQSRWSDFFHGLSLPFSAVKLIFRSPKLTALALVCAGVTFASLVGLVWGLWVWTPDLVNAVIHRPEGAFSRALWYLLVAFSFGLLLVVGVNSVPLAVLSPLQDPLAEATEAVCGVKRQRRFSLVDSIRRSIAAVAHTVGRVALLLIGHALLLLLNLVPGIGNGLWTVASVSWTMAWLAVEYLDVPMTLHRYSLGEVQRLVRQRLGLCLGFGAAVYLLLWIPVINLFLIPLATVAGTMLFRGLVACGALPEEPTSA